VSAARFRRRTRDLRSCLPSLHRAAERRAVRERRMRRSRRNRDAGSRRDRLRTNAARARRCLRSITTQRQARAPSPGAWAAPPNESPPALHGRPLALRRRSEESGRNVRTDEANAAKYEFLLKAANVAHSGSARNCATSR